MARTKRLTRKRNRELLTVLRELRHKLHDIDTKLEHLIRSHRHFYSLRYQERELDDLVFELGRNIALTGFYRTARLISSQ